jgi:hypothetical protein
MGATEDVAIPSGVGGFHRTGDFEIHMNDRWYVLLSETKDRLRYGIERGAFYEGTTPKSVVMHEYAHALQEMLTLDLRNTDEYKKSQEIYSNARTQLETALSTLKDGKRILELWDKEWNNIDRHNMRYIDEAKMLLQKNTRSGRGYSRKYWDIERLHSNEELARVEPIAILQRAQHEKIQKIFNQLGYKTSSDVGIGLTGTFKAYGARNWAESHAECISDYMTNGKNARPVSIAYAKAFAKEIGIRL